MLSVLRYTDSDYPFGVFKLFFLSISVYCRGTGLLEVFFLIWLNDMQYHVRIAPLALHWNFDMTVVMFRGAESIYLEKWNTIKFNSFTNICLYIHTYLFQIHIARINWKIVDLSVKQDFVNIHSIRKHVVDLVWNMNIEHIWTGDGYEKQQIYSNKTRSSKILGNECYIHRWKL